MAMNNNATPSQYFRTQLRELVGVESKIRPLGDWLVKNVQNCNELMDTWCEAITNDTHDAQQIFLYLRAINIVLAKRDKTYVAKISNVMEPVLRELVAGGRVVPHTDVYDKIKDLIMAWQNQKLLDTNVATKCLNVIQPERILHFGGPTSWADEVEMDDPFVTVSPPRNTQHLTPAAQQQSTVKRSSTAQTKSQQPTIQGMRQTTNTTQQKRSIVVTQVQQQVKGNEKTQQPAAQQQKQIGGKVEYGKVASPTTASTPVSHAAPSPQAPRAMTLEERVVFLEKVVTDQNLRLEKYHRQNHKMNSFIKELRKEMATLLQRQLIFERGGHPSPTIPETKLLRSIPTSGSSSMSSTPRTPFSHFNTRLNPNAAPFLPDSASASDLISGTDSVSAFSSAEYTDADYSDDEVATTML